MNYLMGGMAALILLLGWQLKASFTANGELETKLDTQVEQTQECVDANGSNSETIDRLESRIATMVEERRVDTEERERILVERERDLLRAIARADELERERNDEIVSNEQCMEFTSLDPSRFCPATAEQLRLRSRGPGGNGDGDSH